MDDFRRPARTSAVRQRTVHLPPPRRDFGPPAVAVQPAPATVAARPLLPLAAPAGTSLTIRLPLPGWLRRLYSRRPRLTARQTSLLRSFKFRLSLVLILIALALAEIIPVVQPGLTAKAYAMDNASQLLPATNAKMASLLKFDSKTGSYNFNKGYLPVNDAAAAGGDAQGGASITALAYQDASKGVQVTDPVNDVDFTLKPKFSVLSAEQNGNRLVYPLANGSGWLVYTFQAAQVKEDVVLRHAAGDRAQYRYQLTLGDALAARLSSTGSIGIYGSSLPINSSNISTGSEKDAELLAKARQKAPKDTLLFTLPAPFIKETNKTTSAVKAAYQLKGDELTVSVSGLSKANYPLTIDPSVYVKSAAKLMRGNNEMNIDFDTANNQILKGSLTGARIPNWSTNPNPLPTALWQSGTVVAGGFIYVIGGNNGTANVSTVYYAAIDSATHTIGTWNNDVSYNLPKDRAGTSVVAYNGYLYVVGGQDSTCAGTYNACFNVFVSKLSANGEPIGWTGAGAMNSARAFGAAVAYENRLYALGGKNTGGALTANVEYSEINPDGSLSTTGNWTETTPMGQPAYGLSAFAYNGYLYQVSGRYNGGTLGINLKAKILANGIGSWVTNGFVGSLGDTQFSLGGNIAAVSGGYMYVTGGCAASNASDYCTSIYNNLWVASINADGSTTAFTRSVVSGTTSTAISLNRIGAGFVAFDGALYSVGGCSSQNTTTGACNSLVSSVSYGVIAGAGEVGPAQTGRILPSYTATQGATDGTLAGRMSASVIINNGYIYNVGGCRALNGCATMSDQVFYSAIGPDGSIGNWTTSAQALPVPLGAAGVAVYNNTIYIVGGATSGGAGRTTEYHASLTSTGDTGAWSAASNPLAATATYPFVFARTNPANLAQGYLYMVGGCTTAAGGGIGCSTGGYRATVRRCLIATTGAAPSACATTGIQLPTGVGAGGGAVYGNYVYLAGGADNTGAGQTDTVYLAKIDNTGAIVRADGGVATTWQETSATMTRVRRRTTAYAANGYLYVVGGHDGTAGSIATLTDIQIGKINAETGDITSFSARNSAITQRWDLRGAAANGTLYVVGGCTAGDPPSTCTAMDGTVEYVQLYNNYSGSPNYYGSEPNLPTAAGVNRIGASSVVYNDYIYVAGGCTNIGCTAFTNTVEYAPIGADGFIGTWATTSNLGATRTFFNLLAYNGRLYALGGQSGNANTTALSTTEKSTIGANGVLGAWSADTTLGAVAGSTAAVAANSRSNLSSALYNGYIYATGGFDQAGAVQNTVYYALINASTGQIGTWATTTGFTTARSGHTAVAYNGTLYILGGYDGTNYLLDVQYAKISSTGTVGAWTFTQNLPQPVRQGGAFAANGYLYVIAGRSAAATCTNNTYVASISANSTVANGNNPTGLGGWSQTSNVFGTTASSARYGAAISYDAGKVRILGGGCAALITGADRAYSAALQAQPQLAKYSFMIDAGSDVFPSKTLFNGLDNGIGASWQLSYRSSTDAAATWGQTTNYGKTTLGTPQAYVPLNAGGSNTSFSRYHWIELTIDVSQAFGYPEDITRGPTITDLTFLFTSDPAKRLRNGKTFIGGEQQPLDTPF